MEVGVGAGVGVGVREDARCGDDEHVIGRERDSGEADQWGFPLRLFSFLLGSGPDRGEEQGRGRGLGMGAPCSFSP
jgi:hypothetical protein